MSTKQEYTMDLSDTPLTDTVETAVSLSGVVMTMIRHARRMERDRADLLAALEQISERLIRPNDYELNTARNIGKAAIAKAKA